MWPGGQAGGGGEGRLIACIGHIPLGGVSGKPLPTPSGCILALPLLLLPGIAMSVWTLFRGEDKENK